MSSAESQSALCELCRLPDLPSVLPIFELPKLRVVRVLDAADFPAFYRVVWQEHVAEWTDLAPPDRALCVEVMAGVEQALRQELSPRKINLASLGNMVPHLHWHVIARFDWDSHFPQPIWGIAQRPSDAAALSGLQVLLPAVDRRIHGLLTALP